MNKEVKRISEKIKVLEKEIKEKYKAEIIGIFGSYVRGEQNKKSDIDVLVKFYDGATLFEFVGLSNFLEEKLHIKKVDVVCYDTVREKLKKQILSEAFYI